MKPRVCSVSVTSFLILLFGVTTALAVPATSDGLTRPVEASFARRDRLPLRLPRLFVRTDSEEKSTAKAVKEGSDQAKAAPKGKEALGKGKVVEKKEKPTQRESLKNEKVATEKQVKQSEDEKRSANNGDKNGTGEKNEKGGAGPDKGNMDNEKTETGEPKRIGKMTTAEMIAEVRAHSKHFMKGGFIQFIEWLFVFILVAPGTFPLFGCIILSCASFWRRRFAAVSSSLETSTLATNANSRTSSGGNLVYQRASVGDHGALVVRARAKAAVEDRDSEVS